MISIIIPDFEDIGKSLRKLQLLNISNVLKIINRKIIGINNGMFVMCSKFGGLGYSGLGLFDTEVQTYEQPVDIEVFSKDFVQIEKSCKILNLESEKFRYKSKHYILPTENTCVTSKISNNEVSIFEVSGNYLGVNLSFQSDNDADKELLLKILKA